MNKDKKVCSACDTVLENKPMKWCPECKKYLIESKAENNKKKFFEWLLKYSSFFNELVISKCIKEILTEDKFDYLDDCEAYKSYLNDELDEDQFSGMCRDCFRKELGF